MIPTTTRPFQLRYFVLFLISILSPAQLHAQQIPADELARLMAEHLEKIYGDLNKEYQGKLTRVFNSIGAYYADSNTYHYGDKNEIETKAFRELVVQLLEDAFSDNEIGSAMLANLVFVMTPPEVTLRSIAPYLGVGQRLEGKLDGPNNSLVKHFQRRGLQGYPVFWDFVRYLDGAKRVGEAEYPNGDVIVQHMFETDPVLAVIAMLEVDYDLRPYRSAWLPRSEKGRRLQLLNHQVRDFLYRTRYEFPVPDDLRSTVESDLKYAASHEKWWVRLYAAQIYLRHGELRDQDKVQALKEDAHPTVAKVAARMN